MFAAVAVVVAAVFRAAVLADVAVSTGPGRQQTRFQVTVGEVTVRMTVGEVTVGMTVGEVTVGMTVGAWPG